MFNWVSESASHRTCMDWNIVWFVKFLFVVILSPRFFDEVLRCYEVIGNEVTICVATIFLFGFFPTVETFIFLLQQVELVVCDLIVHGIIHVCVGCIFV